MRILSVLHFAVPYTVIRHTECILELPDPFLGGTERWTVELDNTVIGIAFELRHRYTGERYYRFERLAATLQQRFQAIASGLERLWIYLENHRYLQHPTVCLVPIRRNIRRRVTGNRR